MKDRNSILNYLDSEIKRIDSKSKSKYNIGNLEAYIFCKNSIYQDENDCLDHIKFMLECLKIKKNLEGNLNISKISKEWVQGYIDALEVILNKL